MKGPQDPQDPQMAPYGSIMALFWRVPKRVPWTSPFRTLGPFETQIRWLLDPFWTHFWTQNGPLFGPLFGPPFGTPWDPKGDAIQDPYIASRDHSLGPGGGPNMDPKGTQKGSLFGPLFGPPF